MRTMVDADEGMGGVETQVLVLVIQGGRQGRDGGNRGGAE